MFDAKKFLLATIALVSFIGVVASSATIAGCVGENDLPAGAPEAYDGLGAMRGLPPYAVAGARATSTT